MDLGATIIPKSDQLNAEDLLAGPRTFTVTEVRTGSAEQPVNIFLAEFPGRPFRPSKTVRRILAYAWGRETDDWPERPRMTLYREPKVKWAGEEIGGIRVSHLSHISAPMKLALAVSSSKRESFTVQPLKESAPPKVPDYVADAKAAQDLAGVQAVWSRADAAGHLTDALKARLKPIGDALKTEPKPVARILPVDPPELPTDGDWPETKLPGVGQ